MPPVFQQPGGGSSGGNDQQMYSHLASVLQSRYAADADRQQRAQLGYAQLDQQRISEQQNFELSRARLQLQPILQEQQARQEMDNWTMKQEFNGQDQAELNRQNAVVSELMDKRDKGEISDGEFYAQVKQRAQRVNVLQAKEQHTKIQAQAEMRNEIAARNAEQNKFIAQRTELNKKTFEDRVSFIMDPMAHDQMGREVDLLQPGLNPAAREEAIRFRAEQHGLGRHFFQQDIGKYLPLEKGLASDRQSNASGAGGTEKPPAGAMTDQGLAALKAKIEGGIRHDAIKAEHPISDEEVATKANEWLKSNGFPTSSAELQATRHPAEQKAQQAQALAEGAAGAIDAKIQEAQARTDVPIAQRSKQITLLAMAKQMVSVFGSYKAMKPDAKKRYEGIVRDLNATVLPAQPEQQRVMAVPAPPQPGFGTRAMDWAGGVINDLRPGPIGGQ